MTMALAQKIPPEPRPPAAETVYFGIPLKARRTARNWDWTVRDFNRTLVSIYNQTNPNFRVLVGCHDIPELLIPTDERLEFLHIGDPPPEPGAEVTRFFHDRKSKLWLAGQRMKALGGQWFMSVDADDLISSRLVEFVLNNQNAFGYIAAYGYLLDAQTMTIRQVPDDKVFRLPLHQFTGSCAAVKFDPCDISDKSTIDYGSRFMNYQGDHRTYFKHSVDEGRPLEPFPFPAIIYVLNTGENVSFNYMDHRDMLIKRLIPALHMHGSAPDSDFAKDFALDHPLWRGLGGSVDADAPPATGEDARGAVEQRLVDIVVPTHGRSDLLEELLASVVPQLRSAFQCGVIVVNDGTHDASYARVVSRYLGAIDYVPLDRSSGPANARNLGAGRSSASYIAFLDDDCLPPSHWLDRLLALIEAHPEVDVIAGTTRPPPRGKAGAIERFNRAFAYFPRPLFSNGELYCLPSANVAVRRQAFLDAGGFDVDFRFPAGEDLHFFYRLMKRRAQFHLDDRWYATHPVADSLGAFARRWYRYGYGTAQHRIRSDDSRDYGLDPELTPWKLARGLRRHIRYMKRQLTGRDRSAGESDWEPFVFPLLAAIRHISYQLGGVYAFRDDGLPGLRAAPVPAQAQLPGGAVPSAAPHPEKRDIPEFGLIIGAMKCGTSAVFRSLSAHPQVSASKMKEPSFFTTDADFAKGIDWYLDLFDWDPAQHRIAVEANTRHTQHPFHTGAAERMKRVGWPFRFVYVIRDPFDRIRSHYLDSAVRHLRLSPLADGVEDFPLNLSRYWTQLEPYATAFGRDHILVVTHEDLLEEPQATLRRVCRHLGIDPEKAVALEKVHVGEFHYRPELLAREIRERGIGGAEVARHNVLEVLDRLDTGDRATIEAAVAERYTLTEDHKAEIRRALAADMRRLSADYGIDVSRWGFEG